jgi:hypothetical protein
MASTFKNGKIYWIGGSNTTYNYNGIAYNGTGGVPPANRILSTFSESINWEEQFLDEVPMDLRGIANVDDNTAYLMGGMIASQSVTNKIFKIEFNEILSVQSDSGLSNFITLYPNPFNQLIIIINNTMKTEGTVRIFAIDGKEVLKQRLSIGFNEVSTDLLLAGIYFVEIRFEGRKEVYKMLKSGALN